ncbi:MAG: FG-GAP repeat protein [Candidatus Falkowbacteria bacterium]
MKKGFWFSCLCVMILGLACPAWSGQKIVALDGEAGDNFGSGVSFSGDYAVIGAKNGDNNNNVSAGAVYVYKKTANGWESQQKISLDEGEIGDNFGSSVAIDGDYIVIGAWGEDTGTGAAYIFMRSGETWSQQAKLTAGDDSATWRYFGWSVAIEGDRVIISVNLDDDMGINSGSAYVFKRSGTTWSPEGSKLLAEDGLAGDCFGRQVSISGNYVIIGADLDDFSGKYNAGSAYIFKWNGEDWEQTAKLTAEGYATTNDYFGWSVAIDGDYAIVGSYEDDLSGKANAGSAYVFKRNENQETWSPQARLTASDAAAGDNFGWSVTTNGEYAIIGTYGDDDKGDHSGSAYVFKRSGTSWYQKEKIVPIDGGVYNCFGYSVDISDTNFIVGAFNDDDKGYGSGSAYTFPYQIPTDLGGAALTGLAFYNVGETDKIRFNLTAETSVAFLSAGNLDLKGRVLDVYGNPVYDCNNDEWSNGYTDIGECTCANSGYSSEETRQGNTQTNFMYRKQNLAAGTYTLEVTPEDEETLITIGDPPAPRVYSIVFLKRPSDSDTFFEGADALVSDNDTGNDYLDIYVKALYPEFYDDVDELIPPDYGYTDDYAEVNFCTDEVCAERQCKAFTKFYLKVILEKQSPTMRSNGAINTAWSTFDDSDNNCVADWDYILEEEESALIYHSQNLGLFGPGACASPPDPVEDYFYNPDTETMVRDNDADPLNFFQRGDIFVQNHPDTNPDPEIDTSFQHYGIIYEGTTVFDTNYSEDGMLKKAARNKNEWKVVRPE